MLKVEVLQRIIGGSVIKEMIMNGKQQLLREQFMEEIVLFVHLLLSQDKN